MFFLTNPNKQFFRSSHALRSVFSTAHAHIKKNNGESSIQNMRTDQTSEMFYFNLCNCLAWGQTDSDTVSSNLYIFLKIM